MRLALERCDLLLLGQRACVYFSTSARRSMSELRSVGSSALHVIRVYKLCIFATLRHSRRRELVSQRLELERQAEIKSARRAVCPCYRLDGGDKKCVLNIFLWHKWALAHENDQQQPRAEARAIYKLAGLGLIKL